MTWIVILLTLVCNFSLANCSENSKKPNIILIYVDDMGVGDVSFLNGSVTETPKIDAMAHNGKIFLHYYSNSPVCSPSRVAITTGMYPLRWNINTFLSSKKHNRLCDQSDFLYKQAPTIAKSLKSAGYKTAHFGKWHMGGGRDVENAPSIHQYGFDEYVSTWESPDPDPLITSSNWIWAPSDSIKRWERTSYFINKTIDFLSRNKDNPCYINLWPDDIHSPWVPSENAENQVNKKYYKLTNLRPVLLEFDFQIGRLLTEIKKMGLEKNTLIIFTSDNGPAPTFDKLRTTQLRGCKNSLYEGGILMPFIAYWPGVITPGQIDSSLVFSSVDLFPTLCKIAGAKLPDNYKLDGEDVSDAILSESSMVRKSEIYWEYGRMNPKYSIPKNPYNISLPLAVRTKNWKFYSSYDTSEVELFNLAKDPYEKNNIAYLHKDLTKQLKIKVITWYKLNDKSEISKHRPDYNN